MEKITAKEALEKIKQLFAKAAPVPASSATTTDYTVKDGSTLSATPEMAKGNPVHLKTADGTKPAPDGEYELTDGHICSVVGGLCDDLADGADEYQQSYSAEHPEAFAISTEDRKKLADKGHALPDGSFPIRNKTDLKNAVQSIGRASDPEKAKEFIKKRAKDLNAEATLPDEWKQNDETETAMKEELEEIKTLFAAQKTAVDKLTADFEAEKTAKTALEEEKTALKAQFDAQELKLAEVLKIVEELAKDPAEAPVQAPNTLMGAVNKAEREIAKEAGLAAMADFFKNQAKHKINQPVN